MLFTSGRPVVVIPPDWNHDAKFSNVLVAWDGGARAARAVGDAISFLKRAEQIEILCVSPDASKSMDGTDLATSSGPALQKSNRRKSPKPAWRCGENPPDPHSDGESRSVGHGCICAFQIVSNIAWRCDKPYALRGEASGLSLLLRRRRQNPASTSTSVILINSPSLTPYKDAHLLPRPHENIINDLGLSFAGSPGGLA